MRMLLVLALSAAACSGGSKKVDTVPTGTGSGSAVAVVARLEIAEISISDNGTTLFVHADGSVEAVDADGKRQPIGTLTTDGKLTTIEGEVAQLQDDGGFTTKDGPAPFKLIDETLVVGDTKFTIDANGVIQGGKVDLTRVKLTGVTTRGTRRTALLMLGILTLSQ